MSLDLYEKLSVVGKGSYGEVWLVKQKKDNKQYVIKKMELKNASKREKKAAEQEAKLLSKLRHPNIVSYRDSFNSEDGHLYIVMGYCDGGDVYNRLKQQKGKMLEEKQVVEWFVQIAMALQYMHERNILHRDLKTQNIFLTKSKIIKVGDLGIARVLEGSNDMATTLIGTPYYMSPELFSNRPYNYKSDVWALGCCVYEMATLKHAFNAKDMNSLVYKILRGKMPAMPQTYSKELSELIKAMLHQSPDKRPSVARILRNPYIKKHIAMFLEGTRARRPSSSGSEGRRGSKPEITELPSENLPNRPMSAESTKEGGILTPISEVSSTTEKKEQVIAAPAGSGGDASVNSISSRKMEPVSKKRQSSKTPTKSDQPVTPRKGRPLPQPPSKAGTPRTSSSSKKRVSSAPSSERSRSSSSSSVSSSRDEVTTPRSSEVKRSINSSARARRRELRESQEHNIPPVSSKVGGQVDSSVGRDEADFGVAKKKVVHTKSDPSRISVKKREEHEFNGNGRDTDNSSSSGEEDNPEQVRRREEKEIKQFSSLLETTLHLNEKQSSEDRESPEGSIDPEEEQNCSSPDELVIAPAAPRAPKGIGNSTMTTSGRLMDRIAALRKDIMAGVGIEMLQKAYEIFDQEDGDDIEPLLVKLMGRKNFEIYGGKIWQLKFCEETVFG
ncbi:Serine/threonine-protein kinase Nek4 [Holothuria leucospilota]|uniref:Serine/threonine-protein kinase Nek4 n=1 Tax=Holothuria leucospilota TaxID=206669 RepID=A0A9Q1HEU2_HOLLE|nr:Serine/threonine-protein kinase Nek4 [Holothuria leucospilota]